MAPNQANPHQYLEEIVKYLPDFSKLNGQSDQFIWDSVYFASRHFDILWYVHDFQKEFFDYIFKVLNWQEYRSVDNAGVLSLICSLHAPTYLIYNVKNNRTTMGRTNSSSNDKCGQWYLSYMIHLMKTEYGKFKTYWPIELDPISNALIQADEYRLNVLLYYGVSYVQPFDDLKQWEIAASNLKRLSDKVLFFQHADGQQLFDTVSKCCGAEKRKRILTVLKGLNVLLIRRCTSDDEYFAKAVRCLQKVFRTIPEPHITSLEVREFLCLFSSYNASCREDPEAKKIIQELSDELEEILPQSSKPKRPRSLLHLSRCQVRQNLREVGNFPHGVKKLHLPKILYKYILQQDS